MRQEMRGFEDGQIDGAPVRRRPRRLSQLFAQMARDADGPVSISNIRDALGDRSFAALIVFFAALNLIPLPPPSSAILGLPLVIVSAQMMYGSKRAWLPRFVMEHSISAESFRSVMDRLIPRLISLERMIKPRYWPFWRRQGDRVIGVMCFVLAVIVTLPIPLGNWLPAFSSSLLGLALIERDGILFAVGTTVGVVAMVVIVVVFGSATALIGFLWTSNFFHM
jgi:hypothetical protein